MRRRLGSIERLAAELEVLALHDMRDMFDKNGRLIEPRLLPTNVALAVKKFKVRRVDDREELIEVELVDKVGPIDKLLRLRGAYPREPIRRCQEVRV